MTGDLGTAWRIFYAAHYAGLSFLAFLEKKKCDHQLALADYCKTLGEPIVGQGIPRNVRVILLRLDVVLDIRGFLLFPLLTFLVDPHIDFLVFRGHAFGPVPGMR